MSSVLNFTKKHWLTLLLLVGALYAVNRVVVTQRAPGAMSVIEAQAMDMTSMRPPIGVTPVHVETVSERTLAAGGLFPAKIVAFNDQDITARVAGLVQNVLVYPGDKVRAGQLLAVLSASELDAEARAKSLEAQALRSSVLMAQRDLDHHMSLQIEALAKARMAENSVERVKAESEATALEVEKMAAELKSLQEHLGEHEANVAYQDKEIARQRKLYETRVISLAELQEAERDYKQVTSAYKGALEDIRALEIQVEIGRKRKRGAEQAVTESINARTAARAGLAQAEAGIALAKQNVISMRLNSGASSAMASAAAITSNYRELRALADGVVSERTVSPGTAVMPGQIVMKVKSVSNVRVQADVPAAQAANIGIGMPVRVLSGDQIVDTTISAVFPTASESSRTIRVEALINPHGRTFVPGMLAKIQLLGRQEKALAIRKSAIVTDQDGTTYVWLLKRSKVPEVGTDWTCPMHPEISEKGPGICPKCKMDLVPRKASSDHEVTRQAVSVGKSDGTYIQVLSGLAAGDQVVWKDFAGLSEGSLVHDAENQIATPTELQSEEHKSHTEAPKRETIKKAASQTWTCPMHPEVQQDKPGTCPKCKMDLVKKNAA